MCAHILHDRAIPKSEQTIVFVKGQKCGFCTELVTSLQSLYLHGINVALFLDVVAKLM